MNAIVTGATKGIGRAIVELLAEKGFHLAICARTAADVAALQADLQARYPQQQIIAQAVDMSQKEAVLGFAATIRQHWQQVDILVNNAGVFLQCTLADAANEAAFETMMLTNVYSAYYLTREVLPLMLPQGKGHIFNLCSVASFMPYGAYAVSKHALLGFSRALREELQEKGIRVTALMPGATRTPSWDGVNLPESRFMTAEDIAQALWGAYQLSDHTVVEEMILRPQLGDI